MSDYERAMSSFVKQTFAGVSGYLTAGDRGERNSSEALVS